LKEYATSYSCVTKLSKALFGPTARVFHRDGVTIKLGDNLLGEGETYYEAFKDAFIQYWAFGDQ